MNRTRATLLMLLPLLVASMVSPAKERLGILHEERSLYTRILVHKVNNLLCMKFTLVRSDSNQSCKDLSAPKRLVFAYARMTMTALLFNRHPQNILIVGLGGGTLPEAFFQLLDNAKIDTVEIDSAVIKVAKEYFLFEDNERKRVIAQDARVFIKRAILQSTEYDLVILDAFNGDYIPEHLMTKEFLLEVQKVLSRDGVLVANTFGTSKLYDYESNTYQDVFGSFINYKRAETGNRLIIVPQAKLDSEERDPIDAAELIQTARELEGEMSELEVPIVRYARELPRKMASKPDWDQNTEIITDQFSPVNLLRRQSRD